VKPRIGMITLGVAGFADPGGHLWEVAHNPFTDMT